MPIKRCKTASGKSGWQWGSQKCYESKADAVRQMAAIYANGYHGQASLVDKLKAELSNDGVDDNTAECNDYISKAVQEFGRFPSDYTESLVATLEDCDECLEFLNSYVTDHERSQIDTSSFVDEKNRRMPVLNQDHYSKAKKLISVIADKVKKKEFSDKLEALRKKKGLKEEK